MGSTERLRHRHWRGSAHLDGERAAEAMERTGRHMTWADRLWVGGAGRSIASTSRIVANTRLDHRAGAAQHIIGGLEEEDGGARHSRRRAAGCPAIVIAIAVWPSCRTRASPPAPGGEGGPSSLDRERQRVDVGPPRDGRPGRSAVEHAHGLRCQTPVRSRAFRRVQALAMISAVRRLMVAQLGDGRWKLESRDGERYSIVRPIRDLRLTFERRLQHQGVSRRRGFSRTR